MDRDRNKNIDSRWTQGLSKEQSDLIKKLVNSNNLVLDKLRQICYNRSVELKKKLVSESNFSEPNWAVHQAYVTGQIQDIEWILSLLPE